MYYRHGNYTHGLNEVEVVAAIDHVRNEADEIIAVRHRYSLRGTLLASGPSYITAAVNLLKTAYSLPVARSGLFLADGSTPTHLVLSNVGAFGGIRVLGMRFPVGDGTEYVTGRTYEIDIEAEYPSVPSALISFSETVSYQGDGGPRIVIMETRDSAPVIQQVSSRTPIMVVQAGSAIGYSDYPRPPSPLLPVINGPESQPQYGSPQRRGSMYINFPVSWRYVMLLTSLQQVRPNRWPIR